jgi:VanZ family protein/UDP-2,3-diacylglucosamine pyrophosphatase LpxH
MQRGTDAESAQGEGAAGLGQDSHRLGSHGSGHLWFDGRMRRFWIWTLPLLIALAIVWLSSQSHYPGGISLPSPLDKLAHASAFGALACCLELAVRGSRHDLPMYRRHFWIFVGVALFGISDEWHQAFVPGRDCSALDWLADATGAALGLMLSVWPFLLGKRQPGCGWWRGQPARPDPSRPLVLVADPHWGEELTGLREVTRKYPEADWLFLGDVFEAWVGLPGLETESQRSFLGWVQERRHAGRWIGLWLGNRDYFLDRYASHFDLLGEGVGGVLAGEALAFEHGDLVNGADRRYRLWNLVSRSAFTWILVSLLPPSLTRRLAQRLERAMRTTNPYYRLAFPREDFAAAAAQAGPIFLTGHFHTHEEVGSGVALPWAHEGAFALWAQGRLELLPVPESPVPESPVPERPVPERPDATFSPSRHP